MQIQPDNTHLRTRAVVLFVRDEAREAFAKPIGGRFGAFGYAGLNNRIAARLAPLFDAGTDLVVVREGAPLPGMPVQRGSTFGERITNAITDTLALGYTSVVVVGNDCPTLESGDVTAAFERLENGAWIVAAPARDGGAFLVAARAEAVAAAERRERFIALPWCTSALFAALTSLEGAEALSIIRDDFDNWQSRAAERALGVLFGSAGASTVTATPAHPLRASTRRKDLTRTFLTSPPRSFAS